MPKRRKSRSSQVLPLAALPPVALMTQPNQDHFLDRDIQWLEFNRRVLNEAVEDKTPLLEKLRFLAIFTSNLDEFFMKRVGWMHLRLKKGISKDHIYRLLPKDLLRELRSKVLELYQIQADCFHRLVPQLQSAGIYLHSWADLEDEQKKICTEYFRKNIYPVLTPLTVDPGHPFPFISNRSTSLGVILQQPGADEEQTFSRIKIPDNFSRLIQLSPSKNNLGSHFIHLIDVIQNNLQELFYDMHIINCMPFRVTRNADIQWDEEDTEDLLLMISEELRQRRFGEVVRLEHGPSPDAWMLDYLSDELQLSADQVYALAGPLDYTDFKDIIALDAPTLKFKPWSAVIPQSLDTDTEIFQVIRQGDLLVHHPYESFTASVEKFIESAVADPKVLAIKMTVYRTGQDSLFIPLLIKAAEMGKQVVCLVELKARFEEERNIYWAQKLEDAGVHVVYGLVGYKTHAKCALVIRQESDGVRPYVHIGTGNYNAVTATIYDDFGLFTCDPQITTDVVELFHFLTGRSLKRSYEQLLVAPVNMKERFGQMIAEEAEFARQGKPARIIVKCNAIDDPSTIIALYRASQAGVLIDLIVRGPCCLIPGVKGVSENIRVRSVVGRFLEHSRLFYFSRGDADPLAGNFFIGSADWMYRNLHARVEVAVALSAKSAKERVWEVLQVLLADTRRAWIMQSDGFYLKTTPDKIEQTNTQQILMDQAKKRTQK